MPTIPPGRPPCPGAENELAIRQNTSRLRCASVRRAPPGQFEVMTGQDELT